MKENCACPAFSCGTYLLKAQQIYAESEHVYFCTCLTLLCLLIIILHYILTFLDTSIKD